MLVVGLTGGIATGKSTVSSVLKSNPRIYLVDADVIARQVVQPGTAAYSAIVNAFGSQILNTDLSIDRTKLGGIIFQDDVKRKQLNSIVHPAVSRAMILNVLKAWLSGYNICVLDVPLLIEAGIWRWVGLVVVVYCPPDVQLGRLMARDSSTKVTAESRLKAQMPIDEKTKYADVVLDNSGLLSEIEERVCTLVLRLNQEAGWTYLISWLFPPFGVISAIWVLGCRLLARKRG